MFHHKSRSKTVHTNIKSNVDAMAKMRETFLQMQESVQSQQRKHFFEDPFDMRVRALEKKMDGMKVMWENARHRFQVLVHLQRKSVVRTALLFAVSPTLSENCIERAIAGLVVNFLHLP